MPVDVETDDSDEDDSDEAGWLGKTTEFVLDVGDLLLGLS